MINVDWVTFLLKLILVPVFIGGVSFAGRHWGPMVSGWLVGLPLTSAPVAFFLALEQGNVFTSAATQAMMMGIISVSIFSLAYTRVAERTSWLPSVLTGFCAWIACTFLLDNINVTSVVGLPIVLVCILASYLLMPRPRSHQTPPMPPRWEIPARMISATVLVFIITGIAQLLGAELTGLLTPFPIYASILAVFTHRYEAAEHALRLLRGVVVGSITAAIFLLIISSTIISWGIGFAFISAMAVAFVTHIAIFLFLKSQIKEIIK